MVSTNALAQQVSSAVVPARSEGARAVGRLIRLARAANDMSQRKLGELTGYSQPSVCRIERGEHALTARDLALFAEHLDIPLRLVQRAAVSPGGEDPLGSVAPLLEESGDDPVNRRQFLAATTVLALQDSSETSALGWRDVRQVELAVQGLTALDDAQGGDDLFEIAAGQLQRVQSLLNETSYTDEMGSRLLRAAGRLAEHTGWLAFDAYRHQAARAYFNEALYLAELAGDSQLAVLTFASMSMQARHAGRLRESVAAARAARERAARWAPPRLLSELWIREAYALAEMRDPQFRKALHEAYRAFECSDPPAADDWYAFYDDAHFLVSEASCNARFGDHRRAVAVWSQALRQHDASYVRNHALYNLAYADSLVRVKELEEACHVGSIGAEILKRGVTSTRTRVRLQQLVSAMRGFRSEPVAAEFLARYGNMAA